MQRPVAVFCMPARGHFQRLRSVIRGLAAMAVPVCVFTDRQFADDVRADGARFVDLFDEHTIDDADTTSWPFTCRYVTFAGRFADRVAQNVAAIDPSLIVHDTFAVVATPVATLLGLPRVNICAGHAVVPEKFLAIMNDHPIVRVAPECDAAVETLRDRYGMADASPFSYIDQLSDVLNVYGEPPQYLSPQERAVFEPIEFFGSLPATDGVPTMSNASGPFAGREPGRRTVYASFGTVIWPYRRDEAVGALEAVADAFAGDDATRIVISLGGGELDDESRRRLTRPNVSIEVFVDQLAALRDADLFVTHAGLNSVHEAILHRVPMLTYPFVWDHPALSDLICRYRLAIALADEPMSPITADDVRASLDRLDRDRDEICGALEIARGWELDVIARRPAVLQRILDLRA